MYILPTTTRTIFARLIMLLSQFRHSTISYSLFLYPHQLVSFARSIMSRISSDVSAPWCVLGIVLGRSFIIGATRNLPEPSPSHEKRPIEAVNSPHHQGRLMMEPRKVSQTYIRCAQCTTDDHLDFLDPAE